jgi:flavodoxin
MKNLIMYYSWTGSTREAAEAVAQAVGGELFEVTETGRRKGLWGFIKGGFQASFGVPSRIREELPDPKQYDAIYIGTPVWASNPCAAFMAVVNGWAGKTGDVPVHVFAVMADPRGDEKVEVSVQKKLQKAGIVPGAYAWFAGRVSNQEWPEEAREQLRQSAAQWAKEVATS